jgi:lysophospholipase L1-like esterase
MQKLRLLTATLALTCTLAGCLIDANQDGTLVVACLGDSNTWDDGGAGPKWCEFLQEQQPTLKVIEGGTILTEPTLTENIGIVGAAACDAGMGELAIAEAMVPPPDIVIAAFGTNDLGAEHLQPADIVPCYQALQAAAREPVYVALTPPAFGQSWSDQIVPLNDLIKATFPKWIDFYTGFTQDQFYPDGIHLMTPGQMQRATVARQFLNQQ